MTTNKVQTGDSTTGTSTSTTYTVGSRPQAEQGWECPRCGRINAPWKSQCDCSGGYYYPTWYPTWDYKEPWWKQVYCDSDTFKVHPETTTWKAPSTICHADTNSAKPADYENITAWSNCSTTVDSPNNPWNQFKTPTAGGSDYWNPITKTWENIPSCVTNAINNKMQELQSQIDNLKETK